MGVPYRRILEDLLARVSGAHTALLLDQQGEVVVRVRLEPDGSAGFGTLLSQVAEASQGRIPQPLSL